jgi:hypothetical protein
MDERADEKKPGRWAPALTLRHKYAQFFSNFFIQADSWCGRRPS